MKEFARVSVDDILQVKMSAEDLYSVKNQLPDRFGLLLKVQGLKRRLSREFLRFEILLV